MNPRKKESKKWSLIPPELAKQIKIVFEENFKTQLVSKTLKVEGRIYPTEILMRIGMNTKGEIRYQNFEVSVDHSPATQNTVSQINIAVDAIASLMLEYFENDEDHEMPFVWQEYPFEKQTIWLQFSSVNPDLEAEANKLLGLEKEDSILNETEEELAALGLLDDEEIDTSRPKIFRVPTDNENDTLKKKKKKEDMH
jgi:hypothetical protein